MKMTYQQWLMSVLKDFDVDLKHHSSDIKRISVAIEEAEENLLRLRDFLKTKRGHFYSLHKLADSVKSEYYAVEQGDQKETFLSEYEDYMEEMKEKKS